MSTSVRNPQSTTKRNLYPLTAFVQIGLDTECIPCPSPANLKFRPPRRGGRWGCRLTCSSLTAFANCKLPPGFFFFFNVQQKRLKIIRKHHRYNNGWCCCMETFILIYRHVCPCVCTWSRYKLICYCGLQPPESASRHPQENQCVGATSLSQTARRKLSQRPGFQNPVWTAWWKGCEYSSEN